MMERPNPMVIGAPSGAAAAMRAPDPKISDVPVEKDKIGGTGVPNGTLPLKTGREPSREVACFVKNLKKFNVPGPEVSYRKVRQELRNAIHERMLPEDQLRLMQHSHHTKTFTFKGLGYGTDRFGVYAVHSG